MTDDITFWWVVGIAIGIGSIPAGLGFVLAMECIQKWCRRANGPNPIYIRCAKVSTSLVPLINGLARSNIPFNGSELWILGSDGRYIVNNENGPWRKAFVDWAGKGLKIKFIILEADDDVRDALCSLKETLKESFDAMILNQGAIPAVARELETYHPTLFLAAGNNAAWIEGLHHRNSIRAYDVEYISPRVIRECPEKDELFRACKSRLELVLKHSTSLVAEAA